MDLNLKFSELVKVEELMKTCEELNVSLAEVQKVLDQLLPLKVYYDRMSLPSKIEYDLFLVYAYNALQWINLRLQGVDPTNHPIIDEFAKINATMLRWQKVKNGQRGPAVNIGAAKRFVRNGI